MGALCEACTKTTGFKSKLIFTGYFFALCASTAPPAPLSAVRLLDHQDILERENMTESIQLHLLRPGQKATINRVGGTSALRRRFVEMGILKGETILIERHAPLGDPVEYFIKGYHLALRKEEAAQIEVKLHGAQGAVNG